MLKILDVDAAGARVSEGSANATRPPPESIRWIDLKRSTEPELARLAETFQLHPLTIEDCEHRGQRPKLEEYSGYLFIVVHAFTCPSGDPTKVEPLELHAFLGKDFLITVHDEEIPMLASVWQRAASDAPLARRGADFLYYLVVDAIVDANFAILDQLSDSLDDIEDAVIAGAQRKDLAEIFALKRTLVTLRRYLSPQRDVLAMLAKRGAEQVSEKTSVYFRDVYDHLTRIYESIDTGRDLLGNALDAYLSMVAQRTNDIVKRLTILSAVFLPLTFITGFFGQNFDVLPIHTSWLFYAVIAACLVVPAGMLLWFWRSKWL